MNGLTITLINVDQVLQIPTDASQGSVTDPVPTTPQFQISDADLELLAKVIYAEARGEDFTGQVAVGAVVLNRLRATGFPKTIADVIYQPWAFTCVNDGQFSLVPDDNAREAARQAVAGLDPTGGALYYFNPKTATSAWSMSRPVIKQIGRHVFTM